MVGRKTSNVMALQSTSSVAQSSNTKGMTLVFNYIFYLQYFLQMSFVQHPSLLQGLVNVDDQRINI